MELPTSREFSPEEDIFVDLSETSPPSQDAEKRTSRVRRTVFSRSQLKKLEERFVQQTFLSREERKDLAEELELSERQVMIWFQNRRGRLKRRGHHDTAFSQEKLQELNQRRPYPFLYGLLSSFHYRDTSSQNLETEKFNTISQGGSTRTTSPPCGNNHQINPVPYPCTVNMERSVFEASVKPIAKDLTPIDLAVELNIPDITSSLGNPNSHEMTSLQGFPSSWFGTIAQHSYKYQDFSQVMNFSNSYSSQANVCRNMPIQ